MMKYALLLLLLFLASGDKAFIFLRIYDDDKFSFTITFAKCSFSFDTDLQRLTNQESISPLDHDRVGPLEVEKIYKMCNVKDVNDLLQK